MATTVAMPVSNSVTLAQKYIPRLDEVYKRESLSAILDTSNVEWVGADTIKIYKFSTVGMANYSRGGGFVAGDTTGAWEYFTLSVDRGRSYLLDYLDDEESMSMLVASQLSQTERTQVIPEIDAYTFATLASKSGISTVDGATITPGTTDVPNLIDAAEAQMDNDEVPYEGRILFVSPACYMGLKEKIERRIINSEDNINTNVEFYDNMRIIRVPTSRFNTSVTLSSSDDSHDDAGGFTLAGNAINFMIVHPSAVIKVMKHRLVRVFSPAQNPTADGFLVNYRYSAGVFVPDNKVKGIYLHKGTTVSG